MSCYQQAKRSQGACIHSNRNLCNRHCIRRSQHWLIERVNCYCTATRGHVSREWGHVGWETLCHPPYSPDLPPSDYHLFHFLENQLRGKSSPKKQTCAKLSRTSLRPTPPSFTSRGLNN
ncbi:hypothetical protein TNCV_4531131 [Trichonephila clavipes]|nr:hypothetical protein TNCV_4531131 [Trichonephila clavipes]